MSDAVPEGWGWPLLSRKAHYFIGEPDTFRGSLCGKWLFGGELESSQEPSPDDCVVCARKLDKLQKKRAK